MKAIILAVLAIWASSAICFVGVFFHYKTASMFLEQGIKAEGTVVNYKKLSRGRSSVHKPVIQFSDRDSNQREFISEVGGFEGFYTVGQKVEILYLPENPKRAVINDYRSLWMETTFNAGAGCFIFLLGAVLCLAGVYNERNKYK